MLRVRRTGGERVGKGNYWNFATGERVHIETEGILPGGKDTTYYRIRPAVLIALAPALGLAYAVFLPFIGMAMIAAAVAGKLFGGALAGIWKGASFSWKPAEAYLAGQKKKRGKK